MTPADPLVSIVIATYNRSRALAVAVESVIQQDIPDWELIVVGDECTDDTAAVVASFADSRIRFESVEPRCGDQSGPNNRGVELARGRYVALLNHDDLWLPHHLRSGIERFEQASPPDIVFSLFSLVRPGKASQLGSVTPTGLYEPYVWVPASTWIFRRSLFSEIGPWRHYSKGFLAPSQDWLRRAWKAGKRIELNRELTVVRFPSHVRPGCYALGSEDAVEQREYLLRIRDDPDFVEKELTSIALGHAVGDADLSAASLMIVPHLRRALVNWVRAVSCRLGLAPSALSAFLRSPRRGGAIELNHRRRGIVAPDRSPKRSS